jgi:uncharacterized membrane protein
LGAVTCRVVTSLREIGILAAGAGRKEVACQVTVVLGDIGVLAVEKDLGEATSQIVDSLQGIGTLAVGNGLVDVTCLIADALGNVGIVAVGKKPVGVTLPVAGAQKNITLPSVVGRLSGSTFRGALKKVWAQPFSILVPPDIVVVLLWAAATLLLIFLVQSSPVRVAAAIPVILFIPGYLLIGIIFPGKGALNWIERIALSVVLSVAIVPLLVFALDFTPFGITLGSVAAMLTALILLEATLVAFQRSSIPIEERLSLSDGRAALDMIWSRLVIREAQERPYRLILLISLLLLVVGTIIFVSMPPQGEHYTEFYLLDANHSQIDLPYPDLSNSSSPLVVAIRNHEYRPINYTVEVMGVNSTLDPVNDTTVIQEMESISTFNVTVQQNQTVQAIGMLSPPDPKYNILQFLLFPDETPDVSVWGQDRVNLSYRHLDLKARPA